MRALRKSGRTRDLAIGLGAVAFAAALSVWSLRDGFTLAFVFPALAALVTLGFAVLLVVRDGLRARAADTADARPAPPKERAGAVAWGVVVLVAFVGVAEALGFYAASFAAFLAVALPGAGWRRAIMLAFAGAAFVAVVYLLFDVVLAVQTPDGRIF